MQVARLSKIALVVVAALAWTGRAAAQPAEQQPEAEPEPGERGEGAVPRGGSGAVARPAPDEPARPNVTPPKLTRFEHAPYPKAAQSAGITGAVVLRLTIDAEGKVRAAEVVEPAGHGFD